MTLPAGTTPTLTFQARWNIEDCGPDPCDYAYVEVDDGTGVDSRSPARSPPPPRATASTGCQEDWTDGHVRPVGLRRLDDRPALPVRHRRRGARAATPIAVGHLRRRHRGHRRRHGRLRGRRRGRRERLDARRLPRSSAPPRRRRTTTTTSPPTASTCRSTSTSQTGPYNFGFARRGPTTSSTSRTRTACWSGTGTRRTATTTTSEHPGEGEILPIDSHPQPIYNLARRCRGGAGSRPTTRRSRWRRPTRSRCTSTARPSYIRGQAAQPLFDDSRSYWSPAQPNIGVKVPDAGVRIRVLEPDRHVDADPHRAEADRGRRPTTSAAGRHRSDGREGDLPADRAVSAIVAEPRATARRRTVVTPRSTTVPDRPGALAASSPLAVGAACGERRAGR